MGITEEKAKGRFYTPEHIVRSILNLSGYRGPEILRKHVIDNSCGDGAFLKEIVKRYCSEAIGAGYTKSELASELGQYIHGIEIDEGEKNKAVEHIAEIARSFGADNVRWDVEQCDTLTETRFDGKMDFVLGNPPYVRVHHLADTYDTIKRFRFSQNGMTDIFIVFYEIGLNMLKAGGTLGYITPSSLFNSKAACELRRHFVNKNLIRAVVDLKHYQPFEATTYTTIMILEKDPDRQTAREQLIDYYEYDSLKQIESFVCGLTCDDFYIGGDFYFASKRKLAQLARILNCQKKYPGIDVKNGFATLLDSFFIGDWPFDEYVIPVVKGSTGKSTKCLFPYDRNGKLIPYNQLEKNKLISAHYHNYETKLRGRSLASGDEWYGFGRTQGILDVYKRKYSICPIIKTLKDLKITLCDKGTGVYGGLYILTDYDKQTVEEILLTEDFMEYISLLGKYKSGGYYTFSSKDLKRYICFKLSERRNFKDEQLRLFECSESFV